MVAFVSSLCALTSPARAFDTQPHFEITRDALIAEGFGMPAASIGGVNNWFVDYYTNPDRNPPASSGSGIACSSGPGDCWGSTGAATTRWGC